MSATVVPGSVGDAATMTVLWRPGCGFCRVLFAGLEHHDIAHTRVDIWEDDEARASLNAKIGSETVPTVLLGDAVLVNPSVADLLDRLAG